MSNENIGIDMQSDIIIPKEEYDVCEEKPKDKRLSELCRYVGAVIAITIGMCAVAVLITLTIKLIFWLVAF